MICHSCFTEFPNDSQYDVDTREDIQGDSWKFLLCYIFHYDSKSGSAYKGLNVDGCFVECVFNIYQGSHSQNYLTEHLITHDDEISATHNLFNMDFCHESFLGAIV